MRDRHLRIIAGHGGMAWQATGRIRCALFEADVSRFERVIDDGPPDREALTRSPVPASTPAGDMYREYRAW